MILDVGCGSHPKGDVNVDAMKDVPLEYIEGISRNIRNFVLADTERLPFRENTFNVVYASHLLEHVSRPFAMLSELKRVSQNIVYLHIPSPTHPNRTEYHIYRWDSNTFENLLKKIFNEVNIYSTARMVPRMGKLNILRLFIGKLLRNLFRRRQITAICHV